jgi:hypothetical protein
MENMCMEKSKIIKENERGKASKNANSDGSDTRQTFHVRKILIIQEILINI